MPLSTRKSTKKQSRLPGGEKPRNRVAAPMHGIPPEALQKMSACLVLAQSPSDAVKQHLAAVQELADAKAVFVSTLDSARGVLVVTSARGRTTDAMSVARPGEGVVGEAFSTAVLGRDDANGHLAVPLFEAGKPMGVLSILGAKTQATDDTWLAVGQHLSAALQVAQLRDAAMRRTRDLETAVAGLRSLDRAHDELLGNVSHELKSPLTTVKAYLGMARKEKLGPLTDKQRNAFEVCERNSDRLLRLINEMLLMSRLQAGRMNLDDRPFGLRALVEEAIATQTPLAEGAQVTVKLVRSGEMFVKGDRDRLREAMVNVLENAIHYNRKGGTVELSLSAENGVATLAVSDTGVGIPAEDLPHVFDRFYRGGSGGIRRSGAGLGLAIVRQIARLHGGSVAAQSTPEVGTTITLRLPLFAGAVSLVGAPEDERPAPVGEGILLVEDDDDCRDVVRQVLESEGFPVVAARDATEAEKALASSRPALVMLDLRLGRGDGRTLLSRIRTDARLSETPVFVISGAADSAAGFTYDGPERIDGFFEKPLNLQRIVERVRAIVRPSEQATS